MTISAHERWYSKTAKEWPLVVFTAIAVSFFTAFFTYVATIRVENEKVRSADIVKLSDDFQSKFSTIISELQRFNTASANAEKISEPERAQLQGSILLMQLTMSPATGRWPQDIVEKANKFFKDLDVIEKGVRTATTFSELDVIDNGNNVRQLVIDDMVIMRAMQQKAEISYWPFR